MDEADFDSLAVEQIPTMMRIAAVMIGQTDAEDLVQEALIRAWQARTTLRRSSSLRPWLLRIVVNLCHDWHRGRFGTEQKITEPLNIEDQDGELMSLDDDPGSLASASLLDLRRAIDNLPEEYRLVIMMHYYVGLDVSEISSILHAPAATIRTRLRRGVARLRRLLNASQPVEG